MGRTPCCEKNGLKKGPWTQEEDQKLIDYIQKHGCGNWRVLPKNAGLQRCGKSCRLRWTNYLRPDIKRGRFSFEEEETIIQLHSILGNKWSAIAGRLPGRTDNEIKNYWNTHIRKKLLRMGIDPVTHTPRLDLLHFSSILNPPLYNSSQLNVSRLLGGQPLVNPEVLRILANSLLSSQYTVKPSELVDQNLLMSRNLQGSQLTHSQVQNQSPSLVQNISCGPFSNEAQLMQQANVEQFSSNMSNFSSQDCKLNEWQNQGMLSDLTEDYNYPLQNYGYYQQDQFIKDPPPSDASVFQSNDSSVSYQSVLSTLSTPSSSPTPLHSNSSYINSTTTEDERASYCSNMFNFDIQNILDVN